MKPGPWTERGACIGRADVFFSQPRETNRQQLLRIHVAQAICRTCPVQHQCLEFAKKNGEENGIWGGVVFDKRRHTPESHNRSRKRNSVERPVQLRIA